MRKEKELLLGEFKTGFERSLGKRKQLLEVFRRFWDGEKRRKVAEGLGAGVKRVKALRAQVRRRVGRFGLNS